jgi:hypothetical protein
VLVEPGEDRAVNSERLHERDDIDGGCRLLPVAERLVRPDARRPVAPHEGQTATPGDWVYEVTWDGFRGNGRRTLLAAEGVRMRSAHVIR